MNKAFENIEKEPRITKENVKGFTHDKWDMTSDWIAQELGAKTEDDKKKLEGILNELIEEDWLMKSWCGDHEVDEYDPGEAQHDQGE